MTPNHPISHPLGGGLTLAVLVVLASVFACEAGEAERPAPVLAAGEEAEEPCEAGEGGPGAYTGPPATPVAPAWAVVKPTDPIAQLDGGYVHTCALTTAGVLRCWGGAKEQGVVDVPGGWAEVRAGMYQSCGRTQDGAVSCVSTGGPNGEPPGTPGGVTGLPPLRTFDVSEGAICGLDAGGELHCVGNGRVADDAPTGSFVLLSLGFNHACALRADHSLVCWGEGANPDGEPPFQAVPPPWPVTTVAAGLGYHTCALREDATIGCWGGDGAGDGGSVYAGNLRAPPGRFTALSAGYSHTCALAGDGVATCWGESGSPPPTLHFRTIASGADGTCGILTDGNLACWGSDQYGLLRHMPGAVVAQGGGPVATPSTASEANPTEWCRNGAFADEPGPFAIRRALVRVPFASDVDGCPDAGEACQSSAYIVPGDEVVTTRVRGRFVCALFPASNTAGWLPVASLEPVVPTQTVPWDGTWKADRNFLTVKGDRVTGAAFWWTTDPPNVHNAELEDALVAGTGDTRTIPGDDCTITLRRLGDWLVVNDTGGCGGVNVSFDGVYRQ